MSRHGAPFARRMIAWLEVCDPTADALMEATRGWSRRRLFDEVDRALDGDAIAPELEPLIDEVQMIPAWVDFDRIDRGASFFMSTHAIGGTVLGARSLILGYAAPAGNKPLVMSGRLERGVNRRLAETSRFVYDVSRPGELRPGGQGVRAAVRVRLIHAKVRQMIRDGGGWNPEWGAPINQHDMLATVLLFSLKLVEGLEMVGLEPTAAEAEDYQAMWRYIGYLLGVAPELLPATRAEAERYDRFISATQGPPDADARELTRVFLNAPAQAPTDEDSSSTGRPNVAVGYALARELLGDELAEQLAIPKTPLRMALPVARTLVKRLNVLRKLPSGRQMAAQRGERYWAWILENQPSGAVELTLPMELMRQSLEVA